jgi:hypothetical protein
MHEHQVCLYTLLPGMKNATVPLLKQALREMRLHYTNDKRFGEHLVRFQTIMWRSKAMGEPEKREIEEELKMVYQIDRFIDGNPYVEKRVERSHAQGEIQSLQRLAITAIKRRFPTLLTLAQPQIEQIQNTDMLDELILQLASATTEDAARQILQIQENQ